MFGMLAFEEIFIWAIFVSVFMAIIYRVFVKPDEIAEIKKDIKFYKDKISAANKVGDTQKSQEFLGEMMKVNQRMFAKNMKPMIVSMLFAIAVLWLIGQEYTNIFTTLPFALPFVGSKLSWLWWYVLVTFPFSIFFRKLLGVE